jgi:hypothetical protein
MPSKVAPEHEVKVKRKGLKNPVLCPCIFGRKARFKYDRPLKYKKCKCRHSLYCLHRNGTRVSVYVAVWLKNVAEDAWTDCTHFETRDSQQEKEHSNRYCNLNYTGHDFPFELRRIFQTKKIQ